MPEQCGKGNLKYLTADLNLADSHVFLFAYESEKILCRCFSVSKQLGAVMPDRVCNIMDDDLIFLVLPNNCLSYDLVLQSSERFHHIKLKGVS